MVRLIKEADGKLPFATKLKYCSQIKNAFGVMPRYNPEDPDTYIYDSVNFSFRLPNLLIDYNPLDLTITVKPDRVIAKLNRTCVPGGALTKVAEEVVEPGYIVEKALATVLEFLKDELNKTGQGWCRIGNYKTLSIQSPYIDRLKAFLQFNAENGVELKVPSIAKDQISSLKETQDYILAYSDLTGKSEPLTQSQKKKINDSQPDGVVVTTLKLSKPLTDRQRKNKLNNLISKGIGSGNDQKKPKNPRSVKF